MNAARLISSISHRDSRFLKHATHEAINSAGQLTGPNTQTEMRQMRETRKELIGTKEYLKHQLDKAWDTIDIQNKYIYQLKQQIRIMGAIPVQPQKEDGR